MLETIVDLGKWLSLICTTIALIGCFYAVVASVMVRRFSHRPAAQANDYQSVTVLKPLHGAEANLLANLTSFLRQNYPAPVHYIFGVQSSTDPAIEIVEHLKTMFPGKDIDLVIDASLHGSNRKISNLINMSAFIRHEIVVLADSDMHVGPDYLTGIVDALSEPGVGAVTCLYKGDSAVGLWSRLAAMSIETHFLPGVLVGLATGLAKPCFGSTIALTRDTLRVIGGFETFSNQLADDYAMGMAVMRLGLRIAIPNFLVSHTCAEQSFTALFKHELRWARTTSIVDPLGFIGFGVTHAFPLALLAAILGGFDAASLGVIAVALASRLVVQIEVTRDFRLPWSTVALGPLRDLISFAVYLACFVTSKIDWRGQSFAVKADGTLVPLASASIKNNS